MTLKPKKQGLTLASQTFIGKDGTTFLVFKSEWDGSFHTFVEVEAKQAARACGSTVEGNTRHMWNELWKKKIG